MDMLDSIVNAQGGGAVRQLSNQLGLGEEQTTAALQAVMPALAAGFQRNLQSPEGLGSLMSALAGGHHQQYLNNPASLAGAGAVAEGNGILGHVFGSKDVSREVANRAAAETGLGADVIKRLLPLVATMMMGAFAQRSTGNSATIPGGGAGGGILDMLGPMLDRNRNGSMIDDVTSMLGRFMGGRS